MADHYLTDEQVDQIDDLEQGFELLRSFNTKIKSVNTISEIKTKLKSIVRSQFQQGKDVSYKYSYRWPKCKAYTLFLPNLSSIGSLR